MGEIEHKKDKVNEIKDNLEKIPWLAYYSPKLETSLKHIFNRKPKPSKKESFGNSRRSRSRKKGLIKPVDQPSGRQNNFSSDFELLVMNFHLQTQQSDKTAKVFRTTGRNQIVSLQNKIYRNHQDRKPKTLTVRSLLLFSAIWEENHPLKWVHFFHPMSANCAHTKNDVRPHFWVWIFLSQIVTNLLLNATRIVIFFKTFKNCFLFGKTLNFLKIAECGNFFCRMRLNCHFLNKVSFHLVCQVFFAENWKIFKVRKIRKYDEDTEYFEKKNAFLF